MRDDRPLDSLIPKLGQVRDMPLTAVHQRVLEAGEGPERRWILTCWTDPGDDRALHNSVKRVLEAALLAEQSRPPAAGESPTFSRVDLMVFCDLSGDPSAAFKPFGLAPTAVDKLRDGEPAAILQEEAEALGLEIPGLPLTMWSVDVVQPSIEMQQLGRRLASQIGDELWGSRPGAGARQLGEILRLPIDAEGLRQAESRLVSGQTDVIRWLPPSISQGLADWCGVVLTREWGHEVQWAYCEPDEAGFHPPPLLRVAAPNGAIHLPIGLEIMRWWVMPLQKGEAPPAFIDWLRSVAPA